MKKKRKPSSALPGSTIGLISPSGPAKHESFDKATALLQNLGFNVTTARPFREYPGYLAGSIEERVEELHTLFVDPDVDAILSLRGGYGSASLLPYLDFDLIARHHKPFLGYSDVTALHIALWQKAKMVTFHSPMATSDLLKAPQSSIDHLLASLQAETYPGRIMNPENIPLTTMMPGIAEGELVGGNLSVLTSLIGTPYELDLRGKILILEDVGEEPYAIDRMLTQLHLSGKLHDVSGFLIGTWEGCESEDYKDGDTVEDVLTRILTPYKKPMLSNLQAGHSRLQLTLPLGARVRIDATAQHIYVLEQVVLPS
ncbi:S66 peptidase family protein [Geomicrobium sediminis]|uniref:Muramoyltetrapeptide carboxypeptidase n=1 Tax=Geomicrobium sediminis TaxID=1347788 RepID=A0ABS2P9E7_9BACL|nr:LD-carboxypeptidase [Geomicrobium sediminis]MBM7631468.1 muramoyltetrapeptide carboxypeptidase [Geomicrobium sediminis]